MKVYVAAKFNDKERVKNIYIQLKAAGHTITHEWVHSEAAFPFTNNPEYSTQCALTDVDGARAADIFILLSNVEPSLGAATELGVAIATFLMLKKSHVYVVGPHFDSNLFYYHPSVKRKNSMEEVLDEMKQLKLANSPNEMMQQII